jgi:hypothetical protein
MYNKRRESIGRFRTSNFHRHGLVAPDSPVAGEVQLYLHVLASGVE